MKRRNAGRGAGRRSASGRAGGGHPRPFTGTGTRGWAPVSGVVGRSGVDERRQRTRRGIPAAGTQRSHRGCRRVRRRGTSARPSWPEPPARQRRGQGGSGASWGWWSWCCRREVGGGGAGGCRLGGTAAQGGITIAKPNTTAGTPDDGAWIDESQRPIRKNNEFESFAGGLYAQDLIEFIPHWKFLAGLRYDATGVRDQLDEEGARDYGRGFWAQQWLGLKRLAGALFVVLGLAALWSARS